MKKQNNLNQILDGSVPFNLEFHRFAKQYRKWPFLANLNTLRAFETLYNILIEQRDKLDEWAKLPNSESCVALRWRNPPSFVDDDFLRAICVEVGERLRPDLAICALDEDITAETADDLPGVLIQRTILIGFSKAQDPTS